MEVKVEAPIIERLGLSGYLNYALGRVYLWNPVVAGFVEEAHHVEEAGRFLQSPFLIKLVKDPFLKASERNAEANLQRPWVCDGGDLFKSRQWIGGIRSRAECAVQRNAVHVIQEIECFEHRFQAYTLGRPNCPAYPRVHIKRQRRVVLQHTAQLEAAAEALPDGIRVSLRRMDRAVKNKAVPLIVVGAAIILPDVEIVDRRTEKEPADIVESLGVGIGHSIASTTHR